MTNNDSNGKLYNASTLLRLTFVLRIVSWFELILSSLIALVNFLAPLLSESIAERFKTAYGDTVYDTLWFTVLTPLSLFFNGLMLFVLLQTLAEGARLLMDIEFNSASIIKRLKGK